MLLSQESSHLSFTIISAAPLPSLLPMPNSGCINEPAYHLVPFMRKLVVLWNVSPRRIDINTALTAYE